MYRYDTTKQTALSVAFIEATPADDSSKPSARGYTLTGMQDGSVFVWRWSDDDNSVSVLKVLPSMHAPSCSLCLSLSLSLSFSVALYLCVSVSLYDLCLCVCCSCVRVDIFKCHARMYI